MNSTASTKAFALKRKLYPYLMSKPCVCFCIEENIHRCFCCWTEKSNGYAKL